MVVATGLDKVAEDGFSRFGGISLGLLCNQASVSASLEHAIDLLLVPHRAGKLNVAAVFGPEHGLYGHTQDNMIEWEGTRDPRTGLAVHSLYGQHREPTREMLEGVDRLVVDIPDVGARYYTFIWTMALCMKACEAQGIPVTVLDRPNPIGGHQVEGTVLQPGFESFVGLYPLPTRHGMTVGEVAAYLRSAYFPRLSCDIVEMDGWERRMYFEVTGAPWVMPSPNMPTVDTAVPYPGGCLLEATNLSEGRGTTRPFEMIGAPWLDGWQFSSALNQMALPGVHFRPIQFEPTFNKHRRTLCEGAFIHVLDREAFKPVLTHVAIIQETLRQAGGHFQWKPPPYEYEHDRSPIDILAGNDWLRTSIETLEPLPAIEERFQQECQSFAEIRKESLLYQPA